MRISTIADVEAMASTEKSLLCIIYDEEFWIPKKVIVSGSQVRDVGDKGFLEIQKWFAEKIAID